jgi:cyclopropane fatty-acyl-phospholipid synthase-like methyltransferase
MPTDQEIVDYYFDSKLDYQLYNLRADNLSMHYGLWDPTIRSHTEALMNENRVVAETAGISRDDYVLDMGCGYGASAVWLAKHIGCRVLGITLSQDQVDEATGLATKHNVGHLATFSRMDYHRTDIAPDTFDVVIAIESIAHSSTKERVLAEAFRILKPCGRLAIADGFFAKHKTALTEHEQQIARACFEGVHVPPLPERYEFEEWLAEAGFGGIQWIEETSAILPTAKRVNRLGRLLMPVAKVFSVLGLDALQPRHMWAFINQYYAFRDGLGVYGIYLGWKNPPGTRRGKTIGMRATESTKSVMSDTGVHA